MKSKKRSRRNHAERDRVNQGRVTQPRGERVAAVEHAGSVEITFWDAEGGQRPVSFWRVEESDGQANRRRSFFPRNTVDLLEALAKTARWWAQDPHTRGSLRKPLQELAETLQRVKAVHDVRLGKRGSKRIVRRKSLPWPQ